MQLSFFAIIILPYRLLLGIYTENLPLLWGFCILIFAWGQGFFGGSSLGASICLQTIFAIFGIFIVIARIGDRQHFGVQYLLL